MLRSPRLTIRPPRLEDWREWINQRSLSQEHLKEWEPTWAIDALSRKSYFDRVHRLAKNWKQDDSYSFLLFLSKEHGVGERLVGGATLSSVRRGAAQIVSLGYWMSVVYISNGYMTEALRPVCNFAFTTLRLHRIEAACLPNNVPSQRVLTKVGFTQEGRARSYLKIDGKRRDHDIYALTLEDWRDLHQSP